MSDVWSNPAEALAAVRHGRESVLAASGRSPARHLAFAMVMGCSVAVPPSPLAWRSAALVVLACAMVLIVQWDRRNGLFVNGYRRGRTRKVKAAMLVTILPLYVVSSWSADRQGLVWPSIALGVVAAVLAYTGSRWWVQMFRRDVLDGI